MQQVREYYEAERLRVNNELARSASRDTLISRSRLAVFLVSLPVIWFSFVRPAISPLFLLPLLLLFVVLVVVHERALRRKADLERQARYFERAFDRIDHTWSGKGNDGAAYATPSHPYTGDLDIFGRGSLFQLLSNARTAAGEETLALWLSAPASADTLRARQAAVADLRERPRFRLDLYRIGDVVRSNVSPKQLIEWATRRGASFSPAIRIIATTLSVVAAISLLLAVPSVAIYLLGLSEPTTAAALGARSTILRLGHVPLVIVILLEIGFYAFVRQRVRESLEGLDRTGDELAVLARILDLIEREPFESPRLRALQQEIRAGGHSASQAIGRLRRASDLLDSARNQFFAPIAGLLLWHVHLAFRVTKWRNEAGASLPVWIATVGEFEALSSFATYVFEHPSAVFPTFVGEAPHFRGVEMRHPLLPENSAVPNSLELGRDLPLLIVSGSNMSGKSTLLRTVGTHVVLAQAGCVVPASSLEMSPLALGASITILDSLERGISHFYAEVQRIRQIVDLSGGDVPLLFLLDEILHGTNSHDRLIGAEAIIRTLVRSGAVGLVTTHDLALANIADDPAMKGRNIHFEDHIEEGKMTFDYRLREGVVQKSNALELMRAVGLDV